ncbi:MAG: type II secretion system F family protein [Candidatus Pacearchaeota archaeon]
MKIQKIHIIGVVFGTLIILSSLIFYFVNSAKSLNIIYFLIGFGFLIILSPFVFQSVLESKVEREKDEMFLEFTRNLVESVESGTPISKSIINMSNKDYRSLTPHIQKLANQVLLGIPIKDALDTFAKDTNSKTIMRAITLIREAEKTGGNISTILESVAASVSEIEKLKAERRAAISSIVMEGYIIFFVFIVIVITMEVQIIPMTMNIAGSSSLSFGETSISNSNLDSLKSEFSFAFLSLLTVQGVFAGIIIGKISEGKIKAGIKHSFILVSMAILISTGSKIFLS